MKLYRTYGAGTTRQQAHDVVRAQRAAEDARAAGDRMVGENKRHNGRGPNRNGGTPPAPGVSPGTQQLLRAMANRAAHLGPAHKDGGQRQVGLFRRGPTPHTGPAGLTNPKPRPAGGARRMFLSDR